MRKIYTILFAVLVTASVFAQTPQKMSYQAVIRNSSNQLVTNHAVGMKISILQTSATGTAVYVETQTPTTNANGLASIEIGGGTVLTGTFSTINWSSGTYYIKTETDPTGGTSYTISGTSQLLSVPYALYAKASGQYAETDPIFNAKFDFTNSAVNGDLLQYNGTKWVKFTPNYLTSISIPNQVAGDMMYYNGTSWIRIPKGSIGQVLSMSSSNIPTWQSASVSILLAPTAIALAATGIGLNSATINGTVNANGFSTDVCFNWGETTTYENVNCPENPVTGNTVGSVSVNFNNGLKANTTYHYRIKATNAVNVTYSNDMTFTTLGAAPTATTLTATIVASLNASLNGTVNANGYSTAVTFEYGTTTSYGSTATVTQSPVTGDAVVRADITGLIGSTTYHYRVKAVNSLGTTYGSDMTFTTKASYSIGDSYQGGIIFYITGTYPNQHGLICAAADQITNIVWWNGSYVTTNATETAVGTGQTNTTKIVTVQGAGSYAAKLCDDLVLNGYSDWFLPAKDELNLMYINLYINGFGGFVGDVTNYYWSSSEVTGDINYSFRHDFGSNTQTSGSKSSTNAVRAIRAF